MALPGDTGVFVARGVYVGQRTGGPSVPEGVFVPVMGMSGIGIIPPISVLYEEYVMRGRWTFDGALIEWTYPLVDSAGTHNGKVPPGELADIVCLGTAVVRGYRRAE